MASVNGEVWNFITEKFPDHSVIYSGLFEGNYEIFSKFPDTTLSIRITENSSKDIYPRMSPRRDKIAFSSDRDFLTHIYTMNRDGSNINRVTTIPLAGNHNPGIGFSWSADGTQIYYASYDKIYRVNADGSNTTLVATAPAGRNFREVEAAINGTKLITLTVGTNIYDS